MNFSVKGRRGEKRTAWNICPGVFRPETIMASGARILRVEVDGKPFEVGAATCRPNSRIGIKVEFFEDGLFNATLTGPMVL